MTQQPGQGPGQFGPQGPGGPQGPTPYGSSPTPPPQTPTYGSSPTPPPQYGAPQPPYPPQQPGYGAQPGYGQPGPYGAPQPPYTPPQQFGAQQPTYGSPSGGTGQPGYASQPQFTPPQQPYGAPQGQPPNPHGQAPGAWSPAAGLPPAPPKKSKTGLIVGVIALVVVLVGGAGLWLALRPKTTTATGTTPSAATTAATKATTTAATKATTAATKATTTSKATTGDATCSGSKIESDAYTATVPKGWECSSQSSGTLMITDAKFDTVMVMVLPSQTDAAKVCTSLSSAGTMTELPDTQWGGKTAKTEDLATGSTKMHVRCVASSGAVFYLMALPITGTYAEIVAGVDGLTSGWNWK